MAVALRSHDQEKLLRALPSHQERRGQASGYESGRAGCISGTSGKPAAQQVGLHEMHRASLSLLPHSPETEQEKTDELLLLSLSFLIVLLQRYILHEQKRTEMADWKGSNNESGENLGS